MDTITREELKQRLERRENLNLVMAVDTPIYQKVHIPGSQVFEGRLSLKRLKNQEEIIVYCINEVCYTSYNLVHFLRSLGYRNVRHYAGGIEDWEAAGYTLEGSLVH